MTARDDGGPAFPSDPVFTPEGQQACIGHPGMSLRDYFAGQALVSLSRRPHIADADGLAEECYRRADALLAVRAKGGGSFTDELEAVVGDIADFLDDLQDGAPDSPSWAKTAGLLLSKLQSAAANAKGGG